MGAQTIAHHGRLCEMLVGVVAIIVVVGVVRVAWATVCGEPYEELDQARAL